MANIKASFKATSWLKFFMENNQLEYSNDIYPKIIESANVGSSPSKIFETFSKILALVSCFKTQMEKIYP